MSSFCSEARRLGFITHDRPTDRVLLRLLLGEGLSHEWEVGSRRRTEPAKIRAPLVQAFLVRTTTAIRILELRTVVLPAAHGT